MARLIPLTTPPVLVVPADADASVAPARPPGGPVGDVAVEMVERDDLAAGRLHHPRLDEGLVDGDGAARRYDAAAGHHAVDEFNVVLWHSQCGRPRCQCVVIGVGERCAQADAAVDVRAAANASGVVGHGRPHLVAVATIAISGCFPIWTLAQRVLLRLDQTQQLLNLGEEQLWIRRRV